MAMSDTVTIDRERWERMVDALVDADVAGFDVNGWLHNNDLDPIEPDDDPALPRPERGTIHYNNDYILSVDRNPSLPKGKQFDWELMDTNYEDVAKGTAPGIWGAMIGAQAAMIHATAGEPKNE